jgi:hypothetical protein
VNEERVLWERCSHDEMEPHEMWGPLGGWRGFCPGPSEVRFRRVTLYEPPPADDESITFVGNEPTFRPSTFRPVQAWQEVTDG